MRGTHSRLHTGSIVPRNVHCCRTHHPHPHQVFPFRTRAGRGPSAVRLQKGSTMGHGVTPSPPHPPQGLHEYDDNTVTRPPVPPRDQEDCGDPRRRQPPHDTHHRRPSALHSAHRSLTPCAVMSSTNDSDSSHWGTRPGHGNGTRAPPSPQTATPTRHTAAGHSPVSPTCHAGLETLLTADGHPTQGGTDASQAAGGADHPARTRSRITAAAANAGGCTDAAGHGPRSIHGCTHCEAPSGARFRQAEGVNGRER